MWSLVEISSQAGMRFAQARILELSRPDAGTIIPEFFRLSAQIHDSPLNYLPFFPYLIQSGFLYLYSGTDSIMRNFVGKLV